MKNTQRREKLGNLLFNLSAYLLTAVAASELLTEKEIGWPARIAAVVLAVLIILIAWFVTPPNRE